jgi:hypothetical protein
MRLYIDDERPMPADFTHLAKTSAEAISILQDMKDRSHLSSDRLDVVSFDHDLGGTKTDDTSRPVLLWMIENHFWPLEVRFHTANPVGFDWLLGTARRYAPPGVLVNPFSPYAEWM